MTMALLVPLTRSSLPSSPAALVIGVLALIGAYVALRQLVARRRHRAPLLLALVLVAALVMPVGAVSIFGPRNVILATCDENVITATCGPGESWCRTWHEIACALAQLGIF